MIKKLLIFSLVFVGMFTLSACNTDDGPTDLEKLGEAMADLDIALEVSSDITFVTTGLHDVVITWASSDTDVIANDGTVTRPLFTEGDANVTITASLTIGDETLTKTFAVKVLKVTSISEAEQVDEAKGSLLLTVADLVVGDITLPTEVVKDDFTATVTWASSNTALVTDAGVVTRPAEGTANTLVVMTATVTVGAASSTKTFEVMIKAEETAASFASIALLHAGSELYDIVEFQGIVVAIFDGGYFLTDGTSSIGIYNTASTLDIVVGDEVYVKGTYAVYYTLYQIGSVSTETIISSDNAVSLTPVVKTVAEMLALDSEDKLIHGMPYTVTGTVTVIGDYGNLYLVTGDDELLIYYYSYDASLEALEDEVGMDVVITVFYYTDHSSNGPMVVFDGLAADIGYRELTDAEKLAADIAAADSLVTNIAVDDVVLPTVGPNGSTYGTWTSDTLGVFASDGTFVALGAETVTVTFTASVTQGTLPAGTTTIEVVVPVTSSIEEALELEVGDELEVTGVIYDVMYYGIFIEDNGFYIFVYGKDFVDDVEVGDTVTVRGYRGAYSGLAQVSPIDYDLEDTDVAPFAATVMSLGALSNGLVPKGTVATITATYTIVAGEYTDYVLTDSAGNVFEVYYRSNVDELTAFDGLTITLDVVYYNNYNVLFSGVAADVTSPVVYTDAMMAADIAAWIVIEDVDFITDDLTLLAAHDTLTSTITWASDTPAVITDAGIVTRTIDTDTYATLTATVTYGSVTVTREIEVTVADANYEVASLTVTEARTAADDDILVVRGTVTAILPSYKIALQDPAGGPGMIVSSYYFKDEGLVIGDEIIVRGTLDIYNGLYQLNSVDLIDVSSTGNNVIVFTGVTIAQIEADMAAEPYAFQAHNFVFTGLTVTDLSYDVKSGYVVVSDGVNSFIFDDDDIPYGKDILEVGDVLDLSVVAKDFYYGAVRVLVTAYPELDDADIVTMSEIELEIPSNSIFDMNLPLIEAEYGATVTWASDTPAVISADGVVVRPAVGEADASVVLTATITSGTESTTKAFTVVVMASYPPYTATGTEIYISEYIEGGSFNKAIELFNPTSELIILDGYSLVRYSNGALIDDPSDTLNLDGIVIEAGQTLVIYHSDAIQAIKDAYGFSDSVINHNGDDTYGLYNGTTLIDTFGVIGNTNNNYFAKDHTYVRNSSVTSGNTTWTIGEWTEYAKDTVTYIGAHVTD